MSSRACHKDRPGIVGCGMSFAASLARWAREGEALSPNREPLTEESMNILIEVRERNEFE